MEQPSPASRVVVVTGSSSGIGQSIAVRFAAPKTRLFVHGFRNVAGLLKTVELTEAKGAKVASAFANVADVNACESLVKQVIATFGRIDVWINVAGADVLTGKARSLTFDEKLELLWNTDVAGTIRLSRLVADQMANQPKQNPSVLPTILNISWDQAEHGMEGDSGQMFSAVKAAIAAFSKSLAKSTGPHIRVNCIAPGWIQTAWGNATSSDWSSRAQGESAMGRWVGRKISLMPRGCSLLKSASSSMDKSSQSTAAGNQITSRLPFDVHRDDLP